MVAQVAVCAFNKWTFQIFASEGSPANAVNGLWKAAWWRSSCIDFANFLRFSWISNFARKGGGEGGVRIFCLYFIGRKISAVKNLCLIKLE
jgi:hypothetical protein